MRKLVILILSTILSNLAITAQVSLKISEIKVSNIEEAVKKSIVLGGHRGPSIEIFYEIENNSDSTIIIHQDKSELSLYFNKDNKAYDVDLPNYNVEKIDSVILKPGEKIKLENFCDIFSSTEIYEFGKRDYSLDLIQVLPTVTIRYYEKGLKLFSCGIGKISL